MKAYGKTAEDSDHNKNVSFDDFCKNTKVRETFIEYITSLENTITNVAFEGYITEYLEEYSDDNMVRQIFKMFYEGETDSIQFRNKYGNYHLFEIKK